MSSKHPRQARQLGRQRQQAGFTIVEAVVAVAVIAIGILLLSYLFDSIKITRVAQNETVAVNFARRYLDTTKALWLDPTFYDTRTMPQIGAPTNFSYTIAVDSETFTGGTPVAPVSATSPVGLTQERALILSVTTPDGRAVKLSTKIAKPIVNLPASTPPATSNTAGG